MEQATTSRTKCAIKPGDRDYIGTCPIVQAPCEFVAQPTHGGDGIYWAQAENCVMAVPGVGCALVNAAQFLSKLSAASNTLGGDELDEDFPLVPVTVLRDIPRSHDVVCTACEQPMQATHLRLGMLGELVCDDCRQKGL